MAEVSGINHVTKAELATAKEVKSLAKDGSEQSVWAIKEDDGKTISKLTKEEYEAYKEMFAEEKNINKNKETQPQITNPKMSIADIRNDLTYRILNGDDKQVLVDIHKLDDETFKEIFDDPKFMAKFSEALRDGFDSKDISIYLLNRMSKSSGYKQQGLALLKDAILWWTKHDNSSPEEVKSAPTDPMKQDPESPFAPIKWLRRDVLAGAEARIDEILGFNSDPMKQDPKSFDPRKFDPKYLPFIE